MPERLRYDGRVETPLDAAAVRNAARMLRQTGVKAPGGCGAFHFGDGVEPLVQGAGRLRAGKTVKIVTPGAGGYGLPSEPDPTE